MSNRSAGVSIMLGRWFGKKHVNVVYSAPPVLQGRAGARRIRTSRRDVLAVVAYAPPRGTMTPVMHARTVKLIFKWVASTRSTGRERCRPSPWTSTMGSD